MTWVWGWPLGIIVVNAAKFFAWARAFTRSLIMRLKLVGLRVMASKLRAIGKFGTANVGGKDTSFDRSETHHGTPRHKDTTAPRNVD